MKPIIVALCFVGACAAAWAALALACSIALIPRTVANGDAIDAAFTLAAHFVDQFRRENSRLPSSSEFDAWKTLQARPAGRVTDLRLSTAGHRSSPPEAAPTPGGPVDYELSTWRGEWTETYFSRTKTSTVDSPFGLYAGSAGLCVTAATASIGCWRVARRVRQSAAR